MQRIQCPINETYNFGVKLLNAVSEWTQTKGEQINVAILDSGIDCTHNDLRERIKGGINFTTDNKSDYIDRLGHGTFCAGIIGASENGKGLIGVAPLANLYAVKVLNDKGEGKPSWLQQGIEWCIENNIDVINMSLGFIQEHEGVKKAIQSAYEHKIIMIAAVGNDNKETEVEYPARYPEVIGVTAIDNEEHLGNFCTTGSKVEFSAAGVDVVSTGLHNTYAMASGTSFAAPHIAGAIALIQANAMRVFGQKLSLQEIRVMMDLQTEDLGGVGKDNQYGYGLFHF
jgi:subtilisin